MLYILNYTNKLSYAYCSSFIHLITQIILGIEDTVVNMTIMIYLGNKK